MQFYRFSRESPEGGEVVLSYEPSFQWARRRAKSLINSRDEVHVDLVNVQSNKDGVLRLLNGEDPVLRGPIVRSWFITPRGGLKPEQTTKEP
jgi:hypothetical protein